MTTQPDHELVRAYVAQGSERAFQALVARHVDLVYATALRQVGDPGVAEEVTQNVFVTLARKAPRLGGIETLAGWLHRTAVFEAKARIRSELRRRRRESVASERIAMDAQGESVLDQVLPFLDEALLELRERDRLALVLRFFEKRSLREVGVELGIAEDAARKRVDRALERVSEFFSKRGFAAGGAGGAAAWLAGATQAAPAGVAASAAQAGVAAGGAASGLSVLLFKLMAISKTQTAVVCAVLASAPLLYQSQVQARLSREQAALSGQLARDTRSLAELNGSLSDAAAALSSSRTRIVNAETRLAVLNDRREGRTPPPVYRWDDSQLLARVPKFLLRQLDIFPMANKRGQLTDEIKEVLQMTPAETSAVQASIDRFMREYQYAAAQGMRKVDEPTDDDKRWRPREEVRVFEMPDISERFKALRASLFSEFTSTLGAERSEFLRDKLYYWMPTDDEDHGLSSMLVVIPFAHRVRFYAGAPGSNLLGWGMSKLNGEGMSGSMELDDVPEVFRPHLQDWITVARTRPPGAAEEQP